jgi:hypothetical protein
MDRAPKPAPFPVGTQLRYVGTHRVHSITASGELVPLMEPGLVVTVAEVKPGRRGTLRALRDEDGPMYYEDTGDPILDETRDGYSVYRNAVGSGRIIWPDAVAEWEVVG